MQQNELLQQHTTLKVGGPATYFQEVTSEKDLEEAVSFAQSKTLAVVPLGSGSNVLVSDEGCVGVVVHIGIKGISSVQKDNDVFLTACAGELLDDVVAYAVTKGYWGLENLSHIPGTVGAAPVQNVGAYGVEVEQLIASVRVYNTKTEKFEVLSVEECCFGYRNSIFKTTGGKKYIVAAVTFRLTVKVRPVLTYKDIQKRFQDEQPTLIGMRNAVIEIRRNKFPDWHTIGTAGSFFKNPVIGSTHFQNLRIKYPELPGFIQEDGHVKVPLGWVLDKVLHMKGEGTEVVGTYKGQALVLINKGGATATDIVVFAQEVSEGAREVLGVDIQWEVTKIGF